MKIALIWYGKMGKAIEALASPNHEIVLATNELPANLASLAKAEVALEFSEPGAALDNILLCLQSGIPVVSGTTGWLDKWPEALKAVEAYDGAFFYASNFSLGVNIFFALNQYLANIMNHFPNYSISMEEIHHTEKKDAPSGTAVTLAEKILSEVNRVSSWTLSKPSPHQIQIEAKRIGQTTGTHSVTYQSARDQIQLVHEAHDRSLFAEGALQAAAWLIGKKGVFGMQDMLGLNELK